MIGGKHPLRFRPCRRLSLALLLAATVGVAVGEAAAGERAYIRTGQSSLTVFDAKDFLPLGNVQLAGNSLWGMAASPATKRLYAFDINTQTVLVVDAVRGGMTGSISLQELHFTPYGMVVSADGKRLYFAAENRELGLIGVDLERGILMGEFAVPHAWRVVLHPDGSRIYVTTRAGELYLVRASDMAVLGHRYVGGSEIALNEDGSRLYVAGGGGVSVIDTATDQVLARLATPIPADHLAVSGRWAYVGNKAMGVLGVVDLVDGHVEAEITLDVGRYVRVGGINVTADGSRVVVLLDNDLRYKYAVVDGVGHTLMGLHDGVAGALICSSKFIMEVSVPESSFTVTNAADALDAAPGDGVCEIASGSGSCTLRAAVQEANAAPGSAVIALPAGEYVLSLPGVDEDQGAAGDLDVLGTLTIRGAGSGATVIDAAGIDRVLEVGARGLLRLENVTVRSGRVPFRDPELFQNRAGAGILNGGVLILTGVGVEGNSTGGFGAAGVHSDGVLRADDCTFSGNVSVGVIFFRNLDGDVVYRDAKGYGAIYARQAEVTGCRVTGNTGAVALWMDGPLSRSVVSENDAAGVRATSVSQSTVSANRGQGCSAALLVDSEVSGNVNDAPDGCGGGLFWGDPYRKLVVARSTISGNAAARGGGVCAQYFEIGDSTVSGNAAAGDGGGIYVREYDVWNSVRNCTITANTADSDADGAGDGGGVFNEHQDTYYDTRLANTILAANFDPGGEAPDCSGYLGSSQFNLVGNTDGCGFAALAWDITGSPGAPVDPGLGPLAQNGGSTMTHALLAGSPAIDAGHPYVFSSADQRGISRPQDGNHDGEALSDIGAFELAPLLWTITASAGANGSITPAGSVSVPDGESRSFGIAAASHYHVADVLVDGVSVGPVGSWSFDGVTSDHTIAASFAIDRYAIRTSAGLHGTIRPAGTSMVPFGGSLTVRVRPHFGYRVAALIVDGRNVGPRTRYTISRCAGTHVIRARFTRIF